MSLACTSTSVLVRKLGQPGGELGKRNTRRAQRWPRSSTVFWPRVDSGDLTCTTRRERAVVQELRGAAAAIRAFGVAASGGPEETPGTARWGQGSGARARRGGGGHSSAVADEPLGKVLDQLGRAPGGAGAWRNGSPTSVMALPRRTPPSASSRLCCGPTRTLLGASPRLGSLQRQTAVGSDDGESARSGFVSLAGR